MSKHKRAITARSGGRVRFHVLRKALEGLEERRLLAAHIVGSTTVYSTIQAAVDAAVAGQTITVDAGTYPEQVSIFKQLTLKGAQTGVDGRSNARGTGESILTGANSSGKFTSSFKIGANDVVIDGFTVQGENVATTDTGAGIVINPGISGTQIINDIIQNNSTGLYLSNASATDATLIQHNVFRNNNNGATDTNNGGRGIYADGATSGGTLQDVTIDGNFFTLNLGTSANPIQAAIGLEGGAASTTTNINITNNIFDHNGKAVLALNASHLLLDSNVVGNHYDTGSASFRFEGNDHYVTITHNTMYGNGSEAIRIDAKGTPGADDNFVINNNNIFGNGLEESNTALMLVAGQYTGTLNASSNWWGSANGPGGDFTGSGNGISAGGIPVTITPLLTTYAVNSEIPYYGLPNSVTSTINAVDFDFGIDGIGYHDTTSGNSFNQYRPNADVDINTTTDPGSGYDVTNTASGEWLRYTVTTASTGVYTLSARVQSTTAGAKFHYEIDGAAVTSSITIPASANWQTLTQANISLPSGTHVLRLVFDANNTGGNAGNWNSCSFALTGTVSPPIAPTGLTAAAASGQINLAWSDVTGETGFKIERSPDGTNGWTQIGTTTTGVVTYSDTTVAVNTPYFYRVRATNSAGDSPYSNAANAVSLGTGTFTLIPVGATWKYLDNGTNQGTAWTATSFNDATWASGPAELGYGDGDEATIVSYGSNANNKYITTYFRDSFTVSNPASYTALNLGLVRDDGAVVYLNGTEVFRSNMPTGTITYTTLASTNVNGTDESTFFPGTISPSLLIAGTNVIAVEVHQSVATSSDLSFNFNLTGTINQPPTPPTAPSNLVATAVLYNQINLTWADNSSNETGFVLERSPNGTSGWTTIATPGINITSYSDTTGLSGSTQYYYRIRSTDSAGDSGNSNVATATTPAAPVLPNPPSNLVASALSSSQIVLNWVDNSSNETGFIIERSPDGATNWTQVGSPAANATTFTDASGLSGSTQYFYRVRANSAAGPSNPSNTANATTLASTTALPSPWADGDIGAVGTAGSSAYAGGVFTVKGAGADIWSNADAFNFSYIPLNGDGSITAQVTSLTNTEQWAKAGVMIRESLAAGASEASVVITPSNGSVFLFRTATNGASDGDFSAAGLAPYWVRLIRSGTTFTAYISPDGTTWTSLGTQVVSMGTTAYMGLAVASRVTGLATATFANVTTTGVLPAAPSNVVIAPVSGTQINLAWTDVIGETGFKIERSTDNLNFTQVGTTLTGVTNFSDTSVSGSALFYYRIKATNSTGDSLPSNVVSTQTIQPPAAPTNLIAANVGLTQINLTWTDNSNNETGFKVERSLDGVTNWTTLTTTAANVTIYNDTGLSADTKYYYRVRSTGIGGDSTNATANATTAPAAPSNLAATTVPNALQINLTWTDNSTTETGFIIERSPNGTDTWTSVGSAAANATAFSDTSLSLTPGTAFFYRIRATSAVGDSANSNIATGSTAPRPTAPSNLVATSAIATLEIDLTWTDNSSNETGFVVERSPDGTTNWTQVGTAAVNATSFSDTTAGLAVNTTYYYRVRATSTILGASDNSNVANATTAPVPAAPSNLVATASTTSLEIDLTWTDNSNSETGFIVERSPDGSTNWTQVGTPAANATSFNDTTAGLVVSTPYYYRVRAVSTILGASNNSNVASATTAPAPVAPSNLMASASTTAIEIDLAWTDNSSMEDGFIVERSPNGADTWTQVGTLPANSTSFSDTTAGLTVNTPYFYRVRATSTLLGPSSNSNIASATTAPAPTAPTNLVAVASINLLEIDLTWADNSSNESGFIVERSPNGTDTWTQVGTAAVNATSFSDTSAGLTVNATYYYRVRATNTNLGPSNNSNVANAMTAPVPAAPSNLVATASTTALEIDLTWTDNSNSETGFIVERSLDGLSNWTQVGTPAANATSFNDTTAGLVVKTAYYYRVRAVSTILGVSNNSNIANATTAPAPAAPSNLVATASTSSLEIDLTWTDNSNTEDGFIIERSPNGVDTWTQIGTPATNATSFNDTTAGLVVATPYYYRVRAVSANLGASDNSNVATATTPAVPAAPTNLMATPLTTALEIDLTWTDNASNETGFIVERSPDGSTNWTQVGTPAVNATSFNDTTAGLTMGTAYYYRVRAVNTALGQSGNSNVASAMISAVPAAPSNLAATSSTTAIEIDLTWTDNANDETGFIIERSPNGTDTWTQAGTAPANATAFNDTTASLVAGTEYYYRVRAVNGTLAASDNSNVASATTAPAPNAPSNLVATSSLSTLEIDLTWTDNSSNEDGFIIERSPNGTDTWTQVGAPLANATSFSDTTGLSSGATYYYRVRAISTGLGASANSNIANAAAAAAPTAPSNLVATAQLGSIQINLTWNDNSNNETGFIIERSFNGTSGWTPIGASAANVASYSDSNGLSVGTKYYYRVRAIDDYATSNISNVSFATTDTKPLAPSGLAASALSGLLKIDLTWTDNSNDESGFVIERSPNGTDSWAQVGTPAADATTFSDTNGLTNGTAYFYRIRAVNALGQSDNSNIATATTSTFPIAPSNLVATGVSTTEIDLTWTDNSDNETSFIIERSLDGTGGWTLAGTKPANATSFSDTNLPTGSQYFYRVRATNSGLDSANTAVAHSWPLAGTPSSPTPNGVVVNALPATLDWADVPNATSYDVYWGSTLLQNVAVSQYTGAIPSSPDGVQLWHVVAKNADNSTPGPQWSFTLDTTPPTATFGNQTPTAGSAFFDFTVTYADATAGVNTATFDDSDVTVTGVNNYFANATFISAVGNVATYRIAAPGGTWNQADDGAYTIHQNVHQVQDLAGNYAAGTVIGTFASTTFAYLNGSTLHVQFDGTTTPIVLGTNGIAVTVTRGTATLTFNGVAAIAVAGTASGNDALQVNGLIAAPITFTNGGANASVHVLAGSCIFATDLSASQHNVSVTVDQGSAVTFDSSQHLAQLHVNGTATFASGAASILRTSDLAVSGILNLNDNAMILDYNIASPYGDVASMVQSGRSGGTWTGNGIITAMNAAQGYSPLATLAVANASDVLSFGGNQTAVWEGETVAASSLLVRYTYVGDANLDGIINGDDYFMIDTGYAAQATGYVHGDFDNNGRIDADDYFIIDSHYNKASTPLADSPAVTQAAQVVAIPSTINSASLFSDAQITSAYEQLQKPDDLL